MKKKDGYVLDTTYPIFFYKEMQPVWLNTVVNFLGFRSPNIEDAFSYLELACATGTNLIVSAINNPNGYFVGVDFNKAHIDKANESVESIGIKNVEFIHCDFATFLELNNKKFDFIVNHGTFSWVSPIHQKNILDIVSNFLNENGIFYLHYMCYPGSTNLLPIQKLFNLVDAHVQDTTLKSVEIGKTLFSDLNAAGAFVNNSQIDPIIRTMGNSHAYLAHEFLTDYWQPLFSVDLHKKVFESTEMTYLGSANPCDNIDSISIPSKMQNVIKNIQAPALKEYLKDLARDSKQRIDIFQKKPRVLEGNVHLSTLSQIKFKLLPGVPQKGGVTFKTLIGDIKAPPEIISPVLESLSKKDMQFSEFLNFSSFKNNPMFLIETIFLLMNANYIYPIFNQNHFVDKDFVKRFNAIMENDGMNLRIISDSGAVA